MTFTASPTADRLRHIHTKIDDDFNRTNAYLQQRLHSNIPLANEIITRLIESGGKRIRPTVTLLLCQLLDYSGTQHVVLAAIIECLHVATLLHDDVVDQSQERRGILTAHTTYGNQAAVLSGDFLYSRCFEMMTEIGRMPILKVLARCSNEIAAGEITQLTEQGKSINSERYAEIIEAKTAKLFVAACECAAILCHQPAPAIATLSQFGHHFGMAYQLIDDCLDYEPNHNHLGKQQGDDMAQGKHTMPMLLALSRTIGEEHKRLKQIMRAADRSELPWVQNIMTETQALQDTRRMAEQHSQHARQCLQAWHQHPSHSTLCALLDFNLERQH